MWSIKESGEWEISVSVSIQDKRKLADVDINAPNCKWQTGFWSLAKSIKSRMCRMWNVECEM